MWRGTKQKFKTGCDNNWHKYGICVPAKRKTSSKPMGCNFATLMYLNVSFPISAKKYQIFCVTLYLYVYYKSLSYMRSIEHITSTLGTEKKKNKHDCFQS